jgi:signal transduction histidine kinase
MAMQLRAARKRLTGAPAAATMLDTLGVDLRDCTIQMRQLVDELRPPVLDQGLAFALRTVCERFDGSPMRVELDVDGNLDELPAAVEVAMYRIVSEALANTARHARAGTCRVTVRRDRALTVDIADDGIGMTGGAGGVGLDSMRERAAELGGECRIGDAAPGVVIHVRLPVSLAAVPR